MLDAIIFAAILAGIFYPLFQKINSNDKISKKMAASITCLAIALIVLAPLTFIGFSLSKEIVVLYQSIVSGLEQKEINDFFFGEGLFARTVSYINGLLGTEFDFVTIKDQFLQALKAGSGTILKNINKIIGNLFTFIFQILIMMVIVFSFFYEGDKLKRFIFNLSPLKEKDEQKIMDKFNQMNHVTIVCNAIGGVIQGGLSGLTLFIAGIESCFLLTFIMIVLAFIPLIGVSLVTIPCSIYLFLTNHQLAGLLVLVTTSIISFVVENWFKPKFTGKRIQINSSFILLTIIGGMSAFGMSGIFYGPLVGIIFLTVVDIYQENYSSI